MQAGLERYVAQQDWRRAAALASNLSELHLTLGDVAKALAMGEASVSYADRSGDAFERLDDLGIWATALHQAGEPGRARMLFEEAELLQAERQPDYPLLYSIGGYRYCDLLLAEGHAADVLGRATRTLEWVTRGGLGLLATAVDHLSLGRAALALGEDGEARTQLDQSVDGLREAGVIEFTTRGLLARAALFRETSDVAAARRDLDETMRVARRSEMRLFQCDAHLEYARLALAQGSGRLWSADL